MSHGILVIAWLSGVNALRHLSGCEYWACCPGALVALWSVLPLRPVCVSCAAAGRVYCPPVAEYCQGTGRGNTQRTLTDMTLRVTFHLPLLVSASWLYRGVLALLTLLDLGNRRLHAVDSELVAQHFQYYTNDGNYLPWTGMLRCRRIALCRVLLLSPVLTRS